MSKSFLEIVELPSGEVVLRHAEGGEEPLVTIRFSDEAKAYLGDSLAEIGRNMIGAGVEMVGDMLEDGQAEDEDKPSVLH